MVDFWEDFETVRPAAGTAKPFLRPARLKEIVVRNAPTREMPSIRKSLSTKRALLSQSCWTVSSSLVAWVTTTLPSHVSGMFRWDVDQDQIEVLRPQS